jgi:hypothetical protein
LPFSSEVQAWVAADESTALWPLGRIVHSADDIVTTVDEWGAALADLTGSTPALVVDDMLLPFIGAAARLVVPADESELATRHHAGRERLIAALDVLEHSQLGLPDADLTIALTAIALLRLWARWLRQFSDSSVPYLLRNFIRRSGRIYNRPAGLLVELEPLPLDIVVEMAGYTAELERVPWLDGRSIRFSIGS